MSTTVNLKTLRHMVCAVAVLYSNLGFAAPVKDFQVNCCRVKNAPTWLTPYDVTKVATRVESALEWSIRRVDVIFYDTLQNFNAESSLNFQTSAFFVPRTQTIHFSPQKDYPTFASTFGHELVHVIFSQKYKGAIPSWLEEGLANFIGADRKVDYGALNKKDIPDVTTLIHPNKDLSGVHVHYQLSTATAEMIAKKCNLNDLLMLATGKKLAPKLDTFCKIKDVNASVRTWIAEKAKEQEMEKK